MNFKNQKIEQEERSNGGENQKLLFAFPPFLRSSCSIAFPCHLEAADSRWHISKREALDDAFPTRARWI
jgi:hypothetical protein